MYHLLEFNQLQWLKAYIEFNIQKRIEAKKKKKKKKKMMTKKEKHGTN